MKTIDELIELATEGQILFTKKDVRDICKYVANNAVPSDKTIMRVLNAIGYEEESWIQFVKNNYRNN